ncbi:TetR/AcrR family transcriptional regulator [Salinisphaera hydrothermalis]|nr:TetR/AcrR family transcriptional regulator [Salinisphaera hydrothermalis]
MDKQPKRRSSRPRSFDRAEAVETAMRLFRRHGYEGVSVANLTKAIGIAPPSLYAAFGSKAGLYREALDRYAELPGALDGMRDTATLEEAITGLLEAAARAVTAEESGCMISTGLIEAGTEHEYLCQELAARRKRLEKGIALGLERWVAPQEAARLAAFLFAVQQGMSVQARDGASLEALLLIARDAVAGIVARRAMESQNRSQP